jgi:hypothetical protein
MRLDAVPSITVAPGEVLAYKFTLRNRGDSDLAYARTVLPFDPALVTPISTTFSSELDYVEKIENNTMVIHFGGVSSNSARISVIYMRVNPAAPHGAVITGLAGYDWEDKDGNYAFNYRSSAAPVKVAAENLTNPTAWVAVDPGQAPAGTEFGFFSDRFVPKEEVQPALKYPDGSEERLSRGSRALVNDAGRVWLRYDSSGLAPGTYEYILRGLRSEMVGSVPFVVTE